MGILNTSIDKLIPLRDSLLAEIEVNEDWALLNSAGALPTSLEYHSMQFEKTNGGITVDDGVVYVSLKHKLVGGNIKVGRNIRFELGDLPADKTLWAEGQEDDLYEDAWNESGYAEQQELIARVERLTRIKDSLGDSLPSPDITYEWVQRRPAMNCQDDSICQWLFHLRATRGEATSYISEVVSITGEYKPVADYTPDEVAAMAEAYRRINKWDVMLIEDIEEQENAPRSVDGWNEKTLSVDP